MNPIAIFVATRWELQAVRRVLPAAHTATVGGVVCAIGTRGPRTYWLVQTGVGPDLAGRAARTVLREQPVELAVSSGFACGLADAAVGDLIVGTDVGALRHEGSWRIDDDRIACHREAANGFRVVAERRGLSVRTGSVVSAPMVIVRAQEKWAIRTLTQAVALDMESAALASAAQERGVPVAIARTLSDLIDEDLPLDFNLFLRPTGWLEGMQALARRPSSVVGLNRLRTQSRLAADRLSEWFQHYADAEPGVRRSE